MVLSVVQLPLYNLLISVALNALLNSASSSIAPLNALRLSPDLVVAKQPMRILLLAEYVAFIVLAWGVSPEFDSNFLTLLPKA